MENIQEVVARLKKHSYELKVANGALIHAVATFDALIHAVAEFSVVLNNGRNLAEEAQKLPHHP